MAEHIHKFVYLRSGKRNIGYHRNPTWQHYDVFFCQECLTYKEVETKKTRPATDRFGEEDC